MDGHSQISVQVDDDDCKNGFILMTRQNPSHGASSASQLGSQAGKKYNLYFDLYEAVGNGNVDTFVGVLNQTSANFVLPDIFDLVTQAGDSLLHVAAYLGREEIAMLIASQFPTLLTKRNIRGDTALHVAVRSKNVQIVKIILEKYAEKKQKEKGEMELHEEITRLKNEDGNIALHEAVYSGNVDMINSVLQADSDVIHFLNKLGRSPLYLAVVNANWDALGSLLSVPFFPKNLLPQCHGNSPFHAAILARNSDLLKMLLDSKARVLIHLRDEDGGTPLHFAAYTGFTEGIRVLINLRTFPQMALEQNIKGDLPIHLACKMGHTKVVQELLLQEVCSPRVLLNLEGQNILHVAANNGKHHLVRYLLRHKRIDQFTLNEKDRRGNTPLHLASKNLCLWVLYDITKDKRLEVNLTNNEGFTAHDVLWMHSKFPKTSREYLGTAILSSAGVPLNVKKAARYTEEPKMDQMRGRTGTVMVVAILIAAMTFAAGFTLPGGVYSSDDPDPHKRGLAVFSHQRMFQVFIVSNTIAMYSSMFASVVLLLAQVGDYHLVTAVYNLALRIVGLALMAMSLSFMTGVCLVVKEVRVLGEIIFCIGICFALFVVLYMGLLIYPLGGRHPRLLLRVIDRFISRVFIYMLIGVYNNPEFWESRTVQAGAAV